MPTSSFDQIRALAADILDVPGADLSQSSGPESVDSWDSVQHLNLILAVEQQFDLQFEPEEVEGIKSLGGIAELVDNKRAGA